MPLQIPIPQSIRPVVARFVIAFGLTIVAWACAHDIYLIGVEPRHFTDYHRPLLPITNHTLLAIQYATVATLGPGMVFGALVFIVSQTGSRTPHTLSFAWKCFLPFIALIETTALFIGQLAQERYAKGEPLPYPESLYPGSTAGIAYSQSVNITAYLAAAVFGGLFLILLLLIRKPAPTLTHKP